MGSSVGAFIWRDVVGKRWIRCAIWQAVISSTVWVLLSFFLSASAASSGGSNNTQIFPPFGWVSIRFLLFQLSQFCFLLGQTLSAQPEENDAASFKDLAGGLVKLALFSLTGRSPDESHARDIGILRMKIQTTFDYFLFFGICAVSGFVAFLSFLGPVQSSSEVSSADLLWRGAILGLLYAGLLLYRGNLTLAFPIIQRRLFFDLKMGIPAAVNTSFKLALILLPLGETVAQVIPSASSVSTETNLIESGILAFMWRQSLIATLTFSVAFCWEAGHHIIQVLQTKRYVFAPPLGSSDAETGPSDLLLIVLEDSKIAPLVQYHAFLDLCIVSETNVDTWRRAAFFEESGDTYKRLIAVCLQRLDNLTIRLARGLELCEVEKGADLFKHQMQASPVETQQLAFQLENAKTYFRDFQLCAWCARTVASLTASSRFEDRYGVAQLHGCNVAVVSSLLSCLLVVEVYLGRRSSARCVSFVPNSIKWTVPSRGTFMEVGKRQGYPFGKRTVMHKKAYAMADVLRTSLYQIVSVFGDEMVHLPSGGAGYVIAERDWLSQKLPLYGAHEMHLQKLSMFLEYHVG